MTTTPSHTREGQEKIVALVSYIRKEFPDGCGGVICCPQCPLDKAKDGSLECALCELLSCRYV